MAFLISIYNVPFIVHTNSVCVAFTSTNVLFPEHRPARACVCSSALVFFGQLWSINFFFFAFPKCLFCFHTFPQFLCGFIKEPALMYCLISDFLCLVQHAVALGYNIHLMQF